MVDTDTLIEALSRSAAPRRRPAPTWARTLVWTLVALPCAEMAVRVFPRIGTDWTRPGAIPALLSLIVSFAIGGLAVDTAFDISIAGRNLRFGKALAAMIAVWLMLNAISIRLTANPIGRLGEGLYCYTFLMIAGAPMIALAILGLRRTRALYPARSLAVAGLGVSFMSMALLALCHPVGAHLIDFSMHILAGLTIVALTIACGRRAVSL